MIDPTSAEVAGLIAVKAAGSLGEHLGVDAGAALDRIATFVRRRFHGDAKAEQALQRVHDSPGDQAVVSELAVILDHFVRADEAFRTEVVELARLARQDQTPQQSVNVSGNAEVGKLISIREIHGDVSF